MDINLKAKDIFPMTGNRNAWIVRRGAVNVFLAALNADGSYGRRTWLFDVETGGMLAGFEFSKGSRYGIIASAAPEAALETYSIADGGDPVALRTKLLNKWADSLTYALVGYKLPPKDLKFIDAGENIALSDGCSYGARHGEVLWVKLLEGEVETLASYTAFFKGHAGYFPVTDRFWFKIHAETAEGGNAPAIRAFGTEKLLSMPDVSASITAMHSIVVWLLTEKIENADLDEKARLKRKIERDEGIIEGALGSFASIIDGGFAEGAMKYETSDSLSAAFKILGDAAKIKFVIPPAVKKGQAGADPISEIARASMVRHRKILFRDDWWTRDSGPLLGFLEENRQPVALVPDSSSSYKMHSPSTGKAVRVGQKEARSLNAIGYMFYRPLPSRPLSIRDISLYSINAGIITDVSMMLAAGLILSLINMLTPMATGLAFDTLIPEIERTQMAQMTLILISSAACVMLVQFFRSIATLRFENKIDASLQAAVWDRLLALPAPFFRKFSTGDLTMRAMSINSIRQTISGTVFSALLTGSFSVFNFFLLFYYNMKLAMISVVMTLVAVLFYLAAMLLQYNYSRLTMELDGKLSSLVFGILNGIAKFRVAGAENRAFGLWAKLFKEKKEIPVYILKNAMSVFNSVYTILCSGIFFWWIITYESDNPMSSGSFVAFNSAFSTFFSGMVEISSSMMSLLNVFTMYERAKPILEATPEFDEVKEDPGELNGAVEISGVTFKYEGSLAPALNDVSISIKPGEFAAIVGPSGSGKSTLIRLLLGFDRPVSGSILYDGHDLSGIDVRAVRRQIGVVLQNGQLMSGNIMTNIIGSSTLTIDDAWEAARSAGLEEDINSMPMGMHTMISEGASTISGGQKQRILIARALVKKPRIIIFDEATSALDNRTQATVSESLENLHATRIVIAHRLSTIIKADRIFVIENGRLVETGTYAELMKMNGLFKALAERQLA